MLKDISQRLGMMVITYTNETVRRVINLLIVVLEVLTHDKNTVVTKSEVKSKLMCIEHEVHF